MDLQMVSITIPQGHLSPNLYIKECECPQARSGEIQGCSIGWLHESACLNLFSSDWSFTLKNLRHFTTAVYHIVLIDWKLCILSNFTALVFTNIQQELSESSMIYHLLFTITLKPRSLFFFLQNTTPYSFPGEKRFLPLLNHLLF